MSTVFIVLFCVIIMYLVVRAKERRIQQYNLFSFFNRSIIGKIQASIKQFNLFSFGNTQTVANGDLEDSLKINISLKLEESTKQKIQNLIIKDKLDEAFNVLETNIPSNHPNYKDVLQLHQRWSNIEKRYKLQHITNMEAKTETARLVNTLLSIL